MAELEWNLMDKKKRFFCECGLWTVGGLQLYRRGGNLRGVSEQAVRGSIDLTNPDHMLIRQQQEILDDVHNMDGALTTPYKASRPNSRRSRKSPDTDSFSHNLSNIAGVNGVMVDDIVDDIGTRQRRGRPRLDHHGSSAHLSRGSKSSKRSQHKRTRYALYFGSTFLMISFLVILFLMIPSPSTFPLSLCAPPRYLFSFFPFFPISFFLRCGPSFVFSVFPHSFRSSKSRKALQYMMAYAEEETLHEGSVSSSSGSGTEGLSPSTFTLFFFCLFVFRSDFCLWTLQ